MWAMVLRETESMPGLEQVATPHPGPGEVTVRVAATGVGLTVRDKLRRIDPAELPRIPGHEVVGSVAAIGPDVQGLSPGQRVLAYYYVTCGHCRMCTSHREPLCTSDPKRIGEHLDGGYAEYVSLPASALMPVPASAEHVGDADLTVACDALASAIHVTRRAGVEPGARVLVVGGAGGVGVHLCQLLRRKGAEVFGVDVGDDKIRALGSLGVNPIDGTLPDWGHRLASGMDAAIDLVCTDETLSKSYRALAPGATLVRMVTYRPVRLEDTVADLGLGERTLTGSKYCGKHELLEAVEALAEGTITPMVGAVAPLEELDELFAVIDQKSLVGRAAVTFG